MEIKKILICVLMMVALFSMMSCAKKDDISSESQEEKITTPQQETVEAALPEADTKSSIDFLLGEWSDISTPERFVKITKLDSEYQYEDNEGKFPASFKDGILKVKVSESDTADVYIDAKTNNLLSVYQDSISEYSKKSN